VTQATKILAQLRQRHRVTLGKKELTEAHEMSLTRMLCRDQLTSFQELLANQLDS
jgi:heat shock protein HslJ